VSLLNETGISKLQKQPEPASQPALIPFPGEFLLHASLPNTVDCIPLSTSTVYDLMVLRANQL
jgi:hypothetical protein